MERTASVCMDSKKVTRASEQHCHPSAASDPSPTDPSPTALLPCIVLLGQVVRWRRVRVRGNISAENILQSVRGGPRWGYGTFQHVFFSFIGLLGGPRSWSYSTIQLQSCLSQTPMESLPGAWALWADLLRSELKYSTTPTIAGRLAGPWCVCRGQGHRPPAARMALLPRCAGRASLPRPALLPGPQVQCPSPIPQVRLGHQDRCGLSRLFLIQGFSCRSGDHIQSVCCARWHPVAVTGVAQRLLSCPSQLGCLQRAIKLANRSPATSTQL
jgi:hypothetical protein